MRTICIVQARLGSTRLPAKVLLPLPTGRVVLQEVLHRCQKIKGIDQVVCAIPDTQDNDILLGFIPESAAVYRGLEYDVLLRYAEAACRYGADRILRVTSDCPLINPRECERVLSYSSDYACNTLHPSARGWSCEAFTLEMLLSANSKAFDLYDREHVGPWIARNANSVQIMSGPLWEDIPPSLDTLEDYVRIYKIFEEQIEADPSLRAA